MAQQLPRALDICSGAGGFHLGLRGIAEVVLACEVDRSARATYAANFPGTPIAPDVRTLTDPPEHDLLVAGFPCQPFSLAANNKTGDKPRGLQDPRGTLFYEIVRILKARQPAAFILENVPALQNVDDGKAFATIANELEGAGYTLEARVINAAPWVPQNRKRLFFLGVRTGDGDLETLFRLKALRLDMPPKPHPVLASILHEFVDPEHAPGPMSKELHAKLVQLDNDKAGRGFRSNLVGASDVAHTVIARYASANRCSENLILMPDRSFDLTPTQLAGIHKSFTTSERACGILRDPSLPAPVVLGHSPARAGRNAILVGDCERIRRITPREAARLMGFPERFILPTSEVQAYKQMGNAVVPAVVRAIALAMMPLLSRG